MKKHKKIFIAWTNYFRRPDELSRALGFRLFFVSHIGKSRGMIRYMLLPVDYAWKGLRTLAILFYHRPEVVIAQSGPSFCPMVCYVYCALFRKKLIVDAHNSAFHDRWLRVPFYTYVLSRAYAILGHSVEFQEYLEKRYPACRFLLMPSKMPDMRHVEKTVPETRYLLVVLSFENEPVDMIFDGIRLFLQRFGQTCPIVFYIAGDYTRRPDIYAAYHQLPQIRFLGYIPYTAYKNHDFSTGISYEDMLVNAYGIIAVTDDKYIRQHAIVEAMSVHVPVIANESEINARILDKGAVLSALHPGALCQAIVEFLDQKEALDAGIQEAEARYRKRWEACLQNLKAVIAS